MRHEEEREERELRAVERIAHELERIAHTLNQLVSINQVTDFELFQIIQGESMAINGTQQGSTSTFAIGLVPATNFVPLTSGPVVSVDDTLVTLGPVDPKTLQFTASVAATDTGASYNLTISGVNGAGTAISHVFNVPILAAAPVQVTDFSLNQVS
jgi:hypothetical protein